MANAEHKKPTEEELVVFNFVRNQYENKYKQNIPVALKYMTLDFAKRIIGCKLLTIVQDMDFFQLLSTRLPAVCRFNLLFTASDNQYSAKKFHECCDDKPGTVTIIESEQGNVFGGYTSQSWNAPYGPFLTHEYKHDKKAFLFIIKSNDKLLNNRCPLLLKLRQGSENHAVHCDSNTGPSFGSLGDINIGDKCNTNLLNLRFAPITKPTYAMPNSYVHDEMDTINICGGDKASNRMVTIYFFKVIDYQVLQVIEVNSRQ